MPSVLLIPSSTDSEYSLSQLGYSDVFRYLGWNVLVGTPTCKFVCNRWIRDCDDLMAIFVQAGCELEALPIKLVNDRNITVFISLDTRVVSDQRSLIESIKNRVLYTSQEQCYCGDAKHIPFAGNILQAKLEKYDYWTDVVIVSDLSDKHDRAKKFIFPLLQRLDVSDMRFQVFGDATWNDSGYPHNEEVAREKLKNIYGTTKVCLNFQKSDTAESSICINERAFFIALLGTSIQICDNPLVAKYLTNYCTVADTLREFCDYIPIAVDAIYTDETQKLLLDGARYVAAHHTYFNRLADLAELSDLLDLKKAVLEVGTKISNDYCWDLQVKKSILKGCP